MVNTYKLYLPIWFLNCGNWILHVIIGGNDILNTLYRYCERLFKNFILMWYSIKKV